VSHEGSAHRSDPPSGQPGVMTVTGQHPTVPAGPSVGELLAHRYRLDEHLDNDAAGRQIWRGTDTVLRRPVALVVRQPGGEPAAAMLTAAVAASHLQHPHLVSVYDAIDETDRAYLVREWVPGVALRDVLNGSTLDAERATLVTHAIAEAVSALHTAGIVHGNIHPGTVLVADDGRVVLTDAHADGPADAEADVRALGAILYASLTARWPYAEAGHATLPDAVRDNAGRLASPRQVRGGVPRHLDEMAMELLNPRGAAPSAADVAAELARLVMQGVESEYDEVGPMGFTAAEPTGTRRRGSGRLLVGVVILIAIAVIGTVAAVKVLGPNDSNPSGPGGVGAPTTSVTAGQSAGTPVAIAANRVRIVDPPNGDRKEVRDAGLAVDGDANTGWSTQTYNKPYFGGSKAGTGIKQGMGILIDLGEAKSIMSVRVSLSQKGASLELRGGQSDPGSGIDATDLTAARTADGDVVKNFVAISPAIEDWDGTVVNFAVAADQAPVRYLMVFLTKLPEKKPGSFGVTVNEITVLAR
jgi:eukaryotic-like serine/threonine-protein kinase